METGDAAMQATTFKHNQPHKGSFGYEISTGFDSAYERGISEVRVQPLRDGKVMLDVSHSKWNVYGGGKKDGRTSTRTASTTLSREQIRNLIAVLTDHLDATEN